MKFYRSFLLRLLLKALYKLFLRMDKLKWFILAICGRTTDVNELKVRDAETILYPSHHLDKFLAWLNGHYQRTLLRKPLSNQITHQPTRLLSTKGMRAARRRGHRAPEYQSSLIPFHQAISTRAGC